MKKSIDDKVIVELWEALQSDSYDWDNPYKDDMRELFRRQSAIDKESGRMDSSGAFQRKNSTESIKNTTKQDKHHKQTRLNGIIDNILDVVWDNHEDIINWEEDYIALQHDYKSKQDELYRYMRKVPGRNNAYKMVEPTLKDSEQVDDEYEEEFSELMMELDLILSNLSQADELIEGLSVSEREELNKKIHDITYMSDIHASSNDLDDIGPILYQIYNCKNFIKKSKTYTDTVIHQPLILDIIEYHIYHENARVHEQKKDEEFNARRGRAYSNYNNQNSYNNFNSQQSEGEEAVKKLKGIADDLQIPLSNNLTAKEIKKVHRRIMATLHPDSVTNDEEKIQKHEQFVQYVNTIWDKLPKTLKESSEVFYTLYQKIILEIRQS